jgi:hypothetical protein
MRRIVVALIAATFALTLVGCGGSSTPTPAATTTAAAPEAVVAPAASTAVVTQLSENEPDVFSAFPTDTVVPAGVKADIEAKQPMVLFFYDSTQHASTENRKIIDKVIASNRGLVDLFTFNLGSHFTGNASDPVAVDKGFAKDAGFQSNVQLARLLGVNQTPYIVVTDNQGYITWKFRGFVDRDVLERQVLRASN